MQIGQLSRHVGLITSSNGGVMSTTVDNPNNETCKETEL